MNFITGKHIPRRTFLRGAAGVAVGLPLLDAMIPAGGRWREVMAAVDKTRLVGIEMVHGAAGSNDWGATQHLWSPAQIGRQPTRVARDQSRSGANGGIASDGSRNQTRER